MIEPYPTHLFHLAIGLSKAAAAAHIAATERMPEVLAVHGISRSLTVEPWPSHLVEPLCGGGEDRCLTDLQERFIDCVATILDLTECYARIAIGCAPDHAFTQSALSNNPNARWGCNVGWLALVYHPNNNHLVWHEAMHLLGADDCYDEDDPNSPTCELGDTCLMYYTPSAHMTGDPPFLCDRVRSEVSVTTE